MEWHLSGKPYAVQTEAMKRASYHDKFGYFLEMGLGKTAICLNDYITLKNQSKVSRMVVVCPMSLKSEWKAQAEQWDKDKNLVPVIWPNKSKGKDGTMLIMNYESIIGGGGNYLEKFLDNKPDTLMILDESVHIKNPSAGRTKRLLKLCSRARYLRILSGAPMVNSPLDLWAQLRVLRVNYNSGFDDREPNRKLNPYAFRNRYCIMGGFKNKKVVAVQNEEHLTRLINSVAWIAKKKDWADLPEKFFHTRNYKLETDQLRAYNEMHKEMVTEIKGEKIVARMVITKLMKLQQIASGFAYDGAGGTVLIEENSKIKLLKEIVNEIPTKIIIFAHFKASIDLILRTYPDRAVFIRGKMAPEQIEHNKREFNQGEADIIVCQAASAKYGHTLIGNTKNPCHTSIFYENDYNLDTRLQATDRSHRHGQLYACNYIDLIGTPIEAITINALKRKESVASAVIRNIDNLDVE